MSSDEDDFLSGMDEEDNDDEKEVIDVEPNEIETVHESEESAPEQKGGVLQPASENLEDIADTYTAFEQIKTDLLTADDRQKIGGNVFIKKSGYRKIATAFNVSVDIVDKEREIREGVLTWRVTARASAPNGKSVESIGSCASNESNHMEKIADNIQQLDNHDTYSRDDPNIMKVEGKWRRLRSTKAVKEHDILATAETRAKNRAISDLVGGGEVSAEELDKMELMS